MAKTFYYKIFIEIEVYQSYQSFDDRMAEERPVLKNSVFRNSGYRSVDKYTLIVKIFACTYFLRFFITWPGGS